MRPPWLPVVMQMMLIQMVLTRLRHRAPLRCSRCGPGWGVVTPCTPAVDTLCAPCAPGSYSPHHSYHAECWPCAQCGPGLYQAHPCTPVSDTVCDSCYRLQAINASTHCSGDPRRSL